MNSPPKIDIFSFFRLCFARAAENRVDFMLNHADRVCSPAQQYFHRHRAAKRGGCARFPAGCVFNLLFWLTAAHHHCTADLRAVLDCRDSACSKASQALSTYG